MKHVAVRRATSAKPAIGLADLAALDLGSNSFHMVVARTVDGQPVIVDRLREQVQLAAGLSEKGVLSKKARRRALECLERFGQRIATVPARGIRAVGTNTLRVARNSRTFVEAAEAALGHPIEIISGREEARLIYLGVSHTRGKESGQRIVIDIGGGSTECIVGEGFEARLMRSLAMGCVTFSERYFPGGTIRKRSFEQAVLEARLKLRRVEQELEEQPRSAVVGASGTIKAVGEVLRAQEWAESGVTRDGLELLAEALVEAGSTDALDLAGLRPDRAAVFPGGVAILLAIFESLGIDRMEVAGGALREGVLYDLLGRLRHEDVRERTIQGLETRYRIDTRQAGRVEESVLGYLDQVAEDWNLGGEETRRILSWAARLHEIGLAVSFDRHHHHGAYLLANSDMPGFSRDDQQLIAALIAGHRRKARAAAYEEMPMRRRKPARRLAALLRLAVRLHRGRAGQPAPPITLKARKGTLTVTFPAGWLEDHPLTRTDLDITAERLRGIGLRLRITEE